MLIEYVKYPLSVANHFGHVISLLFTVQSMQLSILILIVVPVVQKLQKSLVNLNKIRFI